MIAMIARTSRGEYRAGTVRCTTETAHARMTGAATGGGGTPGTRIRVAGEGGTMGEAADGSIRRTDKRAGANVGVSGLEVIR